MNTHLQGVVTTLKDGKTASTGSPNPYPPNNQI